MKSTLPMLLPGALFGAGLAVSGMTNPAKVLAFLDVSGAWDPSLALVMVGAITAFALVFALGRRHRATALLADRPLPSLRAREPITPRLLGGAALFGLGWGLAGFCPGPALANLGHATGAAHSDAVLFVLAMAAGMLLAQRRFGADR